MSATSTVARGRLRAELLMVSTCTITRRSGESTWDAETGTYVPGDTEVIYSGRCKLQNNSRAVNEVFAGERRAGVDSLELHLPIEGSGAVRRNDVVHIDSNPPDPALVGQELVVQAEAIGSIKTARRLPVEAAM